MKRNDFIIFGQPLIGQAEIDEVVDSLQKSWLGTGPKVKQFEEDFAAYKNTPYSLAVNSCTAGLHLCCEVLDIKPGDEIITTAMTFCATVNAIIHSGATPVIVDIEPSTINIDPQKIEEKISQRTRAIIPVHFAGKPCNMEMIMQIAKKHNLIVIEDCAHAIESEYKGQKTGTIGDFGVFSFYSTKNMVTGEGGMVISSNEKTMERLKRLSLHGMSADAWQRFSSKGYHHYKVEEPGFKYNMMDIQAAIGIHQLKRVDQYWERRQIIWKAYNDAFKNLPIELPMKTDSNMKHGYHLYTIRLNRDKCGLSRDEFIQRITERNIGVGVHYSAIPEHPYYQKQFAWMPDHYPNALNYGQETVSLPISAKLKDTDVEYIINQVNQILLK